jgi:hypothetical protein
MLGRHVQGVANVGSLRDDIEHLYVREGVSEGGSVYVREGGRERVREYDEKRTKRRGTCRSGKREGAEVGKESRKEWRKHLISILYRTLLHYTVLHRAIPYYQRTYSAYLSGEVFGVWGLEPDPHIVRVYCCY